MAGCASPTAEEGVASESALNGDELGGITLTEQPPFDLQLGQAVDAERAEFGWGDGTLLDARCVGGDVHSTLDTMKSIGSPGLGTTVLAQMGMAPDLTHGLVATVPSPLTSPFYLSPHTGNKFNGPTMKLEEVAAFQEALAPNATRFGGFAEVLMEHNSFSLRNEHRLSSSNDCASRYVRGFAAKRFFLYGFRVDFVEEQDVRGFHARFNGEINQIFSTDPAVQAFLVERGAKVSAHVLVSTGLRGWAEAELGGQSCEAANLAACKTLNAKLATMLASVGNVPGNDDTLASTQAKGSTWGAYELMIQTYDHVLP